MKNKLIPWFIRYPQLFLSEYIYIRIAINWGIILGRTTVNVAPVFMEILSGYHGIVVDLMSPAKYHEISAIESSTSRNSWAEYNNNI